MGWNAGYTHYEETVISLYNAGKLDKETLEIVLNPYKKTDMDHGGCKGLKTHDGFMADELVVKILAPEFWEEHDKKMQDFYQRCGVTSWDEWSAKDFGCESPEYREESDLSSEFCDKWAEITETW